MLCACVEVTMKVGKVTSNTLIPEVCNLENQDVRNVNAEHQGYCVNSTVSARTSSKVSGLAHCIRADLSEMLCLSAK